MIKRVTKDEEDEWVDIWFVRESLGGIVKGSVPADFWSLVDETTIPVPVLVDGELTAVSASDLYKTPKELAAHLKEAAESLNGWLKEAEEMCDGKEIL